MGALVVLSALIAAALASSHSEAPGTAKGPRSDLTDIYLFQAQPESSNDHRTVMVMAVSGLQRSDAGPNYSPVDNNFVYQYHIDNNGDAVEDITFQFMFGSKFGGTSGGGVSLTINGVSVSVALAVVGPVSASGDLPTQSAGNNNVEYYRVRVQAGDDYSTHIDDGPFISRADDASQTQFFKPLDYAGRKTFSTPSVPAPGPTDPPITASPNDQPYADYADEFVYAPYNGKGVRIPGCAKQASLFVGPRRDAFSINLGAVFDIVNIPIAPAEELIIQSDPNRDYIQNAAFDTLDCSTVVAFVLEVPTECLTIEGNDVLGAWASVRTLEHGGPNGKFHLAGKQVNRLGNPLINELFIGVGDKDPWSVTQPKDDVQFADYITAPGLPHIINALFHVPVPVGPRTDILVTLMQGLPGLNQPVNTGPLRKRNDLARDYDHYDDDDSRHSSSSDDDDDDAHRKESLLRTTSTAAPGTAAPGRSTPIADLLRLNVTVNVTAAAVQGSMGVLDLDFAGFPNGRRLGDDAVDIYLRVAEGILCTKAIRGILCATGDARLPPVKDFDFTGLCAALPLVCNEVTNGVAGDVGSSVDEFFATLHYTDRSPSNGAAFLPHFPYMNIPVPGNLMGECWRDEEDVNRQFETGSNCVANKPRRGCTAFSGDPSCKCF
jgi:hypothetical protein